MWLLEGKLPVRDFLGVTSAPARTNGDCVAAWKSFRIRLCWEIVFKLMLILCIRLTCHSIGVLSLMTTNWSPRWTLNNSWHHFSGDAHGDEKRNQKQKYRGTVDRWKKIKVNSTFISTNFQSSNLHIFPHFHKMKLKRIKMVYPNRLGELFTHLWNVLQLIECFYKIDAVLPHKKFNDGACCAWTHFYRQRLFYFRIA